MPTVRLNEEIKRKMIGRVLDRAFGAERDKIAEMEERLGRLIREDLYDSETCEKMAALPQNYFDEYADLYVSFGGQRDIVRVAGPVARCHTGYDNVISYAASDQKSRLHADIYRRKSELKEKQDKARHQARAVMDSVSTLRQLLEVWPEVAEFADVVAPEPPTRALAVSVASLNRQLGLGKAARK